MILEQLSEEKKTYILSKMLRIVRTVSNDQPQRVWVIIFICDGFFSHLWTGEIGPLTTVEFSDLELG